MASFRSMIVLISCLSLTGPAFAETIRDFKSPVVKGRKNGELKDIARTDLSFPILGATLSGVSYQFEYNGDTYMIRQNDVEIDSAVAPTKCLPGEVKVASSLNQIGGTQMGSGKSGCAG